MQAAQDKHNLKQVKLFRKEKLKKPDYLQRFPEIRTAAFYPLIRPP